MCLFGCDVTNVLSFVILYNEDMTLWRLRRAPISERGGLCETVVVVSPALEKIMDTQALFLEYYNFIDIQFFKIYVHWCQKLYPSRSRE
jgi:hypothetical protein